MTTRTLGLTVLSVTLVAGGCASVASVFQDTAPPKNTTVQPTTSAGMVSGTTTPDGLPRAATPHTGPSSGTRADAVAKANSPRPITTGASASIDREPVNPYPYADFADAPIGQAAEAVPMGVGPVSQISFSPVGADFDPVVTPDGKKIVFASTQHRHTADIYVKDIEGSVVTQITSDPADDIMPAVSPDGKFVAFSSNRSGNWDVYVAPITGGQAVRVTSDEADELHPSWSPDGTKLVYCRYGDVSARWELWVTEVRNPTSTQFLGYGTFPKWCPKAGTGAGGADRILFQLGRERGARTFGVWTIDFKDGKAGQATEVAGSATAALINPTWSPDGGMIAFAEVPVDGRDAGSASATTMPPKLANLWIQNVNGTGKIKVTEGTAIALMPAWTPDNRIVFMSPRGGVQNLWAVDAQEAVALAKGETGTATAAAGGNAKAATAAAEDADK